jgi:hypothetical protein
METTVRADFEQPCQSGLFPTIDWGESKLKTDANLARSMGLQPCVHHAADIVIVDLHGKATIAPRREGFQQDVEFVCPTSE